MFETFYTSNVLAPSLFIQINEYKQNVQCMKSYEFYSSQKRQIDSLNQDYKGFVQIGTRLYQL